MKGGGNILSVTAIAINPGSMASARNSTLETFRKVCPLLAGTRHKKILRSPRNPVHISHSLWVVLLPFCHSNFGPGMLSKHDNLVCMGQGVVLF